MPADTMHDMILGFAVIIAGLLSYVLSLFIRTRKAKTQKKNNNKS